MNWQLVIETALGAAVPVALALWRLSGKLSTIETRISQVEGRLENLDEKREQIALIPTIVSRLNNLESAFFRSNNERQ